MFEISLIKKYLYPRFKQLSVSIISLLSILVVTVVVWLVLVFMSVVNGMEKNWTEKLIALSAPMQIMPTEEYYQSDYYQVDAISYEANYSYKTIEEKLSSDPAYDPQIDEEPSYLWIPSKGRDLVKEVFQSIQKLDKTAPFKVSANDFQVTLANARFRLLRSFNDCNLGQNADSQSFLTQIAYLASFEPQNNRLQKTLLPISPQDITNIFSLLSSSAKNIQQDQPEKDMVLTGPIFRKRLDDFLNYVDITHLKTGKEGYRFPRKYLSYTGQIKGLLVGNKTLLIPKDASDLNGLKEAYQSQKMPCKKVPIDLSKDLVLVDKNLIPLKNFQLTLPGNTSLRAELIYSSLKNAIVPAHLKFLIKDEIQNTSFSHEVFFNDLEIAHANIKTEFNTLQTQASPLWAYQVQNGKSKQLILPDDPEVGVGVLLPKSYRESGVLCGDRGYLSYQSQTTSSMQEMRIPVFAAGFYDPGLIPNSGKVILAPKKIISTINSAISVKDSTVGNGINVWFDSIKEADYAKDFLTKEFKQRGIERFWQIKTYKEYEYAKDFIEQLSSDKTLFTLVAIIIIMVACTNIISMLILLVNDKRKEIGILQAMGAPKKSIAFIFGGCGLAIGLLSSLVGTALAYVTLKNIGPLMSILNKIQGHPVFNPAFFGESLPTTLNQDAFIFVLASTAVLSLISGLIPAIKAMQMNPADILKSEN